MFSCLSLGALFVVRDFPTAIELAVAYDFGGLDPDIGYLSSLDDHARVREIATQVAEHGLRWGVAPLPIDLTAPASEFAARLAELPTALELYAAAGVTALGTWIRPIMRALRDTCYDGPVKAEPFMRSLADQPIELVLTEVSRQLRQAIGSDNGVSSPRVPPVGSAPN